MFFQTNRFSVLWDNSPAFRDQSQSRNRSVSTKRKAEDTLTYAEAAAKTQNDIDNNRILELCDTDIAKVSSLSLTLSENVEKIEDDNPLKATLILLSEAISGISRVQESLANIIGSNLKQRQSFPRENLSHRFEGTGALPKHPGTTFNDPL